MTPPDDEARMRRLTRRSFAVGAGAALGGFGFWKWLQTRSEVGNIPWPFRKTHELNEGVGRALFSPNHRAKEFDPAQAGEPRENGRIGWDDAMPAPDKWALKIQRPNRPEQLIPIASLAGLPRVEATHELKCVEGWSQIVTWGGIPFGEFMKAFDMIPAADSNERFLLLSTHNGVYTSALDLASAMHPQTLLCDRINGQPLPADHGGPLRIVVPVKYGIKNIKWLATIQFLETKPNDYWTDRGYDWYAGL